MMEWGAGLKIFTQVEWSSIYILTKHARPLFECRFPGYSTHNNPRYHDLEVLKESIVQEITRCRAIEV